MKITKKLIVTLLALVLLSLNITGFAYYTGDVEESEYPVKFETAVQTLYDIGILPSNDVTGYEDNVTREDFAGFVNAFGGTHVIASTPVEDDITMGEAVKMLVEMSDNVALAEYYGTYPTGYFVIGDRMGITHGLAAVQEYDKITYAMAVQMLYNAMRITPGIVKTVTSGGKMEYVYDANCTVLTEYLDVTLKRGFVTADGFWSLNPGELPGDNGIVIDGRTYRLKNALVDDFVGFEVNYFYHTQDDRIVAIEKTNKANKVVLRGSNITNFTSNTYFYEVNGKETKYQLDDNVYVVSNYKYNLSTSIDMWPANADVVLVDADGNKKYETVLIKTYTEIEVQVFDAGREQLVSKAGTIYDIPKDVPLRIYSDGKIVDAAKVKSGSYATIVVDLNNDVREIYLSTAKVKGSVTSYDADSRNTTVSIDGEEYKVSSSVVNGGNMSVGVSATFILNFKGEISNIVVGEVESSGTTSTQFGYLIKMRKLMGDTGDVYRAKILTEKGVVESLDLIDNVKVNRARVTGDVRTLFGATLSNPHTEEYTNVTRQVIEYTTNEDGKITKITTALPYDTQNNRVSSEVHYGDYKLHESMVGSVLYDNSSFNQKLLFDSEKTVLFSVPANPADENDYNFTAGKGLVTRQPNDIVAYNFEYNAPVADVVVVKKSVGTVDPGMCGGPGPDVDLANDPLMMVTKVTHEYHEDYGVGFDVVEYVNINSGAVSKKIVADNANWTSENGTIASFNSGRGSKDLKPGDLFHMKENGLGEIGTIFKSYDYSDACFVAGKTRIGNLDFCGNNGTYNPVSNSFYSGGKFYEGYPVASGADYLITSSLPTDTFATANRDNLKYYKKHATQTRVYKISVNGNSSEYEISSLEAIAPSVNGNSKAVIYTSWVSLQAVIIYEQ
ncbi:MAG: hypothetical protein UIM24_03865 [Clostridia bacterium]|nr:hypothetical protein [Clostridia bacterium]